MKGFASPGYSIDSRVAHADKSNRWQGAVIGWA
jgi:hypothetical protein